MIRSVHLCFVASLACSLVFGGDLTCDFDGDGVCGVADIDMLSGAADSGEPCLDIFDFDDNGSCDDFDRDRWLESAGSANGLSGSYLTGDTNLDGKVDSIDLNAVGVNWLETGKRWSEGNISWSCGQGGVNSCDLMTIGINWQQSVPLASPVPEPQSLLWILLVGVSGVFCFRKQNHKP